MTFKYFLTPYINFCKCGCDITNQFKVLKIFIKIN